jgi:hypothetical protein
MVGTRFETRSEVGAVLHAYRDAGLFDRWPIDYVESHREGTKLLRVLKAFDGLCVFLAMLCRTRSAVLHVHSAAGASFWRKSLFMALALLARWPVVFHLHGTGFATFYDAGCGPVRRALVRFFLDRAACIVVVSQRWCAWMHRVSRNAQVVVIAPPVAVPPPASARDPQLVADLCDDRHAGSAALQAAVRQLAQRHPGLRLERACGLGPRARADLFARAAVAVMPDHAEGLPLRLLEAMAAGAPVIACAVGGVPDVIDPGFNGLMVAPGDDNAIAAHLARLLEQPALAREMGRAARATIASRFAPDRAIAQLDRVYARLGVAQQRSPEPVRGGAVPPALFPTALAAPRRLQENRA